MTDLWHGGRRWEGSPEVRPPKQGKYECGPGIYLTTNYLTAKKYGSGGGVTTRVTLATGIRWLQQAKLPVRELVEYLDTAPRLKARQRIKDDFLSRQEARKLSLDDYCDVERLVNLLINESSLAGNLGVHLAAWLTSKGIDASLHSPKTGEQWVIVFNPNVIRKPRVVSATVVELADYDLPAIELPTKKEHTMTSATKVASRDVDVPGFPGLAIRIYGEVKSATLTQAQEQGYYVTLSGATKARSELSDEQRTAVKAYLEANFPEHAKI